MHVVFDDRRAVFAPHTGIGRYSELLLDGLDQLGVTLVRVTQMLGEISQAGIVTSDYPRKALADQVLIPAKIRPGSLYHALWHEASPLTPARLVLSLHDLSIWRARGDFSRIQRLYYGHLIRPLVRRAKALLVPSQFTAREIAEVLPAAKSKVHVVTYPVDPAFLGARDPARDELIIRALGLEQGRYLIYTGGFHARKEAGLLLAGVGVARERDIFAGPLVVTGPQPPAPLLSRAECDIKPVGVRTVDELVALYRGAAAAVTASRHEGFGYPAAEAVACGTPLVCPDAGALPETAGGAASEFAAGNPEALATAIAHALRGDPELVERRAAARAAAARFSVRRAARDVVAAYEAARA